jgi:hypothetical protein
MDANDGSARRTAFESLAATLDLIVEKYRCRRCKKCWGEMFWIEGRGAFCKDCFDRLYERSVIRVS